MNSPDPKYQDPNIAKLYNDLLKLNLKSLTPEQSSETWEVVKLLYKKERSKRWRKMALPLLLAVTASAAVGTYVYISKTTEQNK